ncbi:cytidylyltransferase domain-containing protein [Brevibacillus sp. GCM10020057]|uniref:cytidylyltransferase domain-containing protein n=1 Tax=Brevibacillus sp. GCM10020057 TaxID=3317327 RepID=UPI00362DF12F
MRKVVIIQARMGSTRLPGKVMKKLIDQTVLSHVVKRAQSFSDVNDVVIATTRKSEDDVIAEEAKRLGVPFYRGSENDVLSRYYEAAKEQRADVIVRITSDCPLIDPLVSSEILKIHLNSSVNYTSNTLERSYPRGLDTEVFSFAVLETANREAIEHHQREHVTPFVYENTDRFSVRSITCEADYSHYRWTLDTQEDWELIEKIYQHLYQSDRLIKWKDCLDLMRNHPDLALINAHVTQKSK